jgi:hypothetical protein
MPALLSMASAHADDQLGHEHTLADDMLFWECEKGRYYAGQVGGTSRFETRRPKSVTNAAKALVAMTP